MSVRVVTVGARGYATAYVRPLLENMHEGKYVYAGVIARDITKSSFCDRILEENIVVCKSLKEYFEQGNQADLVIISTPPHLHKEESLLAIRNGADVLCEKPIASLYEDALSMLEESRNSGKFIGIGYQWSFSEANRSLKADILAGKLGKPKELKGFVSWPRGWNYYDGAWKGKIQDENGTWILDSVVGNAAAHYLHNMYFLLGDAMDTCDFPSRIRCELFRANKIQNFDTCLLDIETRSGAKLLFAASHATEKNELPRFCYTFENAVVSYNMEEENNRIKVTFSDGTVKDYGDPGEGLNNRLWDAIDSVTSRKPLMCTVQTALAHTLTVNQLYENGAIIDIPEEMVVEDEAKQQTVVNGLYELMRQAFDRGCLLSDLGIEWAEAKSFLVNVNVSTISSSNAVEKT